MGDGEEGCPRFISVVSFHVSGLKARGDAGPGPLTPGTRPCRRALGGCRRRNQRQAGACRRHPVFCSSVESREPYDFGRGISTKTVRAPSALPIYGRSQAADLGPATARDPFRIVRLTRPTSPPRETIPPARLSRRLPVTMGTHWGIRRALIMGDRGFPIWRKDRRNAMRARLRASANVPVDRGAELWAFCLVRRLGFWLVPLALLALSRRLRARPARSIIKKKGGRPPRSAFGSSAVFLSSASLAGGVCLCRN